MIPSIHKAVKLSNIRIRWFDVFDVIILYKMVNLLQSKRDDKLSIFFFLFELSGQITNK